MFSLFGRVGLRRFLRLPLAFFLLPDGFLQCLLQMMKGVVGDSQKVQAIDRGPRGLRWTKHETLTLIAAKREEIEKTLDGGSSAGAAAGGGGAGGNDASSSSASDVNKWVTVFHYCKQLGVDRDASQCRKRWHSIHKDYQKIKDHELVFGIGSYWSMNAELRREHKLAAGFEHDVFEALEIYCCRRMPAVTAAAKDAVTHSVLSDHKKPSNYTVAAVVPTQVQEAHVQEDSPSENGDADQEVAGVYPVVKKKKKKRQRESIEEQLISVLEKSSQDFQRHLGLDRELWKEQARGLVEVLNKLVDVVGTMAEAMQKRSDQGPGPEFKN